MSATASRSPLFRSPLPRHLGREGLFRQIGPLVGATMLWLLSWSGPSSGQRPGFFLQGGALIALAVVATAVVPWGRLPEFSKVGPPVLALLVGIRFELLLDVRPWSSSAFVLLPVFWLAAFSTRPELWTGLTVAVVGLAVQTMSATHLSPEWRETAALGAATVIVGLAISALFGRIRGDSAPSDDAAPKDLITGLPSRKGWEQHVPELLSQAAEGRQPACVIALHIDRFRAFEGKHGNRETERFLRGAAAAWRDHLRKDDLLARVGDAEFAVLLSACSAEAGVGIARRLSVLLEAPHTTSAGIAEWDGMESAAALSRRAEAAMARAEQAGGNQVEFRGQRPVIHQDAEAETDSAQSTSR